MKRDRLPPIYGLRAQNNPERVVVDSLNRQGYTAVKNGWPDFLAWDGNGSVRFIEVKPHCRSALSPRQRRVAGVLATIGITVELISVNCVCGEHAPLLPSEKTRPA